MQVKRNRSALWERIALDTALSLPLSTFEEIDEKSGRQVIRRVELYENNSKFAKGWNNIKRLIKVRRWGHRDGKEFTETSYYISSKPFFHASTVARIIQSHWSIENELHWIKDANMGEDNSSIKTKAPAVMMSYFNNLALNLLRAKGFKPTKNTFAKFANKVKELIKLFK